MPRSKRPWTFNSSGSSRPRISPSRLLALARWSHNFSFQVVENIEFIKFCRALRGNSYNPPHRHRISSHLLPNLYKELETSFHAEIKGQNTTLQVDGWKDVQNDPTLGFAVACNGKDWLYKLEDTLGTRHTIENLGSLIGEVFPLSHACFLFTPPPPFTGNQESENHWVPSVLLCH